MPALSLDPVFRSSAHATVAVVALAAAVYATASLSGGWLGTPPWWERPASWAELTDGEVVAMKWFSLKASRPRDGRELVSASIAAVGYALFAVAAWPRRDRPGRDEEPTP